MNWKEAAKRHRRECQRLRGFNADLAQEAWEAGQNAPAIVARRENTRLILALQAAEAALEDHIGLADGLDGAVGDAVLAVIADALAPDADPARSALWEAYWSIWEAIASEDGLDALDAADTLAAVRSALVHGAADESLDTAEGGEA
jgi:hypothetical protein